MHKTSNLSHSQRDIWNKIVGLIQRHSIVKIRWDWIQFNRPIPSSPFQNQFQNHLNLKSYNFCCQKFDFLWLFDLIVLGISTWFNQPSWCDMPLVCELPKEHNNMTGVKEKYRCYPLHLFFQTFSPAALSRPPFWQEKRYSSIYITNPLHHVSRKSLDIVSICQVNGRSFPDLREPSRRKHILFLRVKICVCVTWQ